MRKEYAYRGYTLIFNGDRRRRWARWYIKRPDGVQVTGFACKRWEAQAIVNEDLARIASS